jgi:hypothetical protein
MVREESAEFSSNPTDPRQATTPTKFLSNLPRTWTKNELVVSGVDMERWVHDMGNVKRFPPTAIPKFLHEMTHHWCFNSPVGLALQLLTFHAVHREYDGLTDRSPDYLFSRVAAMDLFKVNFWQALMLPFAEGLALFAEHDATPGDSPTISVPLDAMSIMSMGYFSGDSRIDTGQRFDNLNDVLTHVRMTELHFRRKANLLLEPFLPQESPYLCGYLAVKALHFEACRRNSRFFDSDFFLLFMKSYIFDDWRAVQLLLDSTPSPKEAAENISNHCHAIFSHIEEAFDEDVIDSFVKRTLNENNERCHFTYCLGAAEFCLFSDPVLSISESERGHVALASILDDVMMTSGDRKRQFISALQFSNLLVRPLLTLGRATFRADLNDSGRLIVWRADGRIPHASVPVCEETIEPWSGEVTAVLAYSTATKSTHLIYLRNAVFFAAVPPLEDDDVKVALGSPFIDPAFRVEEMSVLNLILEAPLSVARSWRSQLWDTFGAPFHGLCCNLALLRALDKQKACDDLKKSGFFGVVSENVDSIEQLAALSLSAGFRQFPDEHLPTLSSARVSIDTIEAALRGLYGFDPLFRIDDGSDLAWSLI